MTNNTITADSIIRGLGGNLDTGMCKCPAHDDTRASLHVQEKGGTVVWYCHAGCSQDGVMKRLQALQLWPSKGSAPRFRPKSEPAKMPEEKDTWATAQALLRAGEKSKEAPVAYLRKRGISLIPQCAKLLPRKVVKELTGKNYPAMIVPITDTNDEPQGAQVTWLTADATEKLGVADGNARRTYGKRTGGFVRLGEPDPKATLTVGEGTETTLSAMEIAGLSSGIAALGNFESLTALPPCSEVLIAADNDKPGITGAEALARRLVKEDYRVKIAVPEKPEGREKYDWNDALVDAKDGGDLDPLRTAILDAKEFEVAQEEASPEGAALPSPAAEKIAERLDALAKLDPVDYDLAREATAKEIGVRLSTLDAEVERRRAAGAPSARDYMKAPRPWPEPVDGAALLDELFSTVDRYVVMTEAAVTATALWIIHAHTHDAAQCSPFLFINSPTKRCGKTQLISIVSKLVPKPLPAVSLTAATVFRAIELWKPTLLIDEADAFIHDKGELRGVLDGGHSKGSYTLRCVGDNQMPTPFSTWAPKAIASIGRINPTLEDRSIVIEMKRKLKTEKVERMPRDPNAFSELLRKCARWAKDNLERLRVAEPKVPEILNDRARDNWLPLMAIAEAAGGDWPALATEAAKKLSGTDDDETPAIQLLEDLQRLFEEAAAEAGELEPVALASADIVTKLTEMEARPWPEWYHGKPITARGVARLLKPFKVFPRKVRPVGGGGQVQGYREEQFKFVFARYLPTIPPSPLSPAQTKGYEGDYSPSADAARGDKIEAKPLADKGLGGIGGINSPPPGNIDRKRFGRS